MTYNIIQHIKIHIHVKNQDKNMISHINHLVNLNMPICIIFDVDNILGSNNVFIIDICKVIARFRVSTCGCQVQTLKYVSFHIYTEITKKSYSA